MSNSIRFTLSGLACAGLLLSPAFADPVEGEPDIIITASRIAEQAATVSVPVTVLDAARLEAVQAVDIAEALAATPSISFTRNGGPGAATQVRIRGAEADHTLVVIDGVKLSDPALTGGGYSFGNLLAGDLERIEVLRGPQSALWGSQAIGGVVGVVTRAPTAGVSGQASLEGGSYGTAFGRAAAGVGGDWGGLRIAASRYVADGYSAADEDAGASEDDGFRQTTATARADVNITDFLALDLRGAWFDGRTDFDGFAPPTFAFGDTPEYGETTDMLGYAGVRLGDDGDALSHRAGVAYTQTDRTNHDPSFDAVTFDSRGAVMRYDYQGAWRATETLRAVFGLERERSSFETHSIFDFDPAGLSQAVIQDSLFGQVQLAPIKGLTLTGGGRFIDHETFGEDVSLQLGAVWALEGPGLTVRANYGEGFKAPSLYQLYSEYGDTALQPEEARAVDLGVGLSTQGGRLAVEAMVFGRETENQIDFVSCVAEVCATRPFGLYANTAKARATGVELALATRLTDALDFTANATFQDAENRSPGSPNRGRALARRADVTANAELAYDWTPSLTTSLAVRHVGDSFDNAANTVKLDAYTLVDLRGSWAVTDGFEVFARIENLGDEDYQTIAGYGVAGRAAYLGLRARIG